MPHLRRLLAAALFLLIALLAPASALAALDVRRVGDALTVIGSTSGDTQITIDADDRVFVSGSEVAVNTSTPGSCDDQGEYVECGEPGLTSLSVTLTGTGNDYLEISDAPFTPGAPLAITTGAGDDDCWSYGNQPVTADLGAGDDRALTGDGPDEVHGGPGNDEFRLGGDEDQAFGDEGSDTFSAESDPDGSDRFDGGADPQTIAAPQSGDTIEYSRRRSFTRVTLPADSQAVPEGENGAAGEDDRLAHVENAIGPAFYDLPEARSILVGNERANALRGGPMADSLSGLGGADLLDGAFGADDLDGGDGDDLIDARIPTDIDSDGFTVRYDDPDTSIICGAGDDAMRRSSADPAGVGCEHDAPLLLDDPTIVGTPKVGGKLTIGAKTLGDIVAAKVTWFACASLEKAGLGPADGWNLPHNQATLDLLECREVGTDASYAPTTKEIGLSLAARVELPFAYGEGDTAITGQFGPVTPIGAGGGGGIPAPPSGPTGSPQFLKAAATQAQQKLGTGAFASNIGLGAGTALYESAITKGGIVVLRGAAVPAIAGVACEQACSLTVTGSLLLIPKATKSKGKAKTSKKAKAKAAKPRTLKLKPQSQAIAAGSMEVVRMGPTSAQRKLIKRARKAKITFAYTLKHADGTVRKAKKSYVVKAK